MSALPRPPVARAFLYSLIASVGLGALGGVITILSGKFGWLEVRVLLTTATIAAASICGLACGAYLATGRGVLLPIAGIALTGAAAVLVLFGLWAPERSEFYWKTAAIVSVYAVACAHLAMLSLARLADWFRWSLVVAYVTIFGVATLIALIIAVERFDHAGIFRLLGVAAILDAAITLLIPIFHRLSRADLTVGAVDPSELKEIDAEIATLRARLVELERRKQVLGDG